MRRDTMRRGVAAKWQARGARAQRWRLFASYFIDAVGQRTDRWFVLDLERSGSDVPESEIGVGAACDLSPYPQAGSGAFADIGTGLSGGPHVAHDVASSGRNDELAEGPSHAGEHSSDHDGDGRVEWTSSGGTSEYAAECRAAPAAQEDGDGNRPGSNADKWECIGNGATEVVT